jgi:hypothetical protein
MWEYAQPSPKPSQTTPTQTKLNQTPSGAKRSQTKPNQTPSQTKPNQAKTSQTKPQAKPRQTKPNQAKPNPKPSQTKQTKPNQTKPNHPSNVGSCGGGAHPPMIDFVFLNLLEFEWADSAAAWIIYVLHL